MGILYEVRHLKYYLLPGRPSLEFREIDLYNKAYSFWKATFKPLYEEHSKTDWFSDDFFRQHYVGILVHKDEIAAVHLYTVFRLDTAFTKDHKYFSIFDESTFELLAERGAKSVLTMESLAVAQNFRKELIGIRLGEVLIGLGMKIQAALKIDAAVGPARKEVKAEDMAKKLGAIVVQQGVVRGGMPCDLMLAFAGVPKNLDPVIADLIEYFWTRRQDLTGEFAKEAIKKDSVA